LIIEIPTEADFKNSGLGFINLALDQIFELYSDLSDSQIEDWGEEVDIEAYWYGAKNKLRNSLALVQQGIEFILKGRIASISPFLLIANKPKDWPSKWEKEDISFAEFKILDAHDLIKTINVFHSNKLSEEIICKIDELRRRRNTIMHTVSNSVKIDAREIAVVSLQIINEFVEPFGWISVRRKYLEDSPASTAFSCDHVELLLLTQTHILIDLLSTSEASKYLGYKKTQRKYICQTCKMVDEYDTLDTKTGLLKPNTPTSTNVNCFICEQQYEVKRIDCSYCNGNVIEVDENKCLTCGEFLDKCYSD